jgi:hypothetical protein
MTDNASVVVAGKPVGSPTGRRGSWAWPVATVMVALILVVGVPVAYLMMRAAALPGRLATTLAQAAAEAVRPKVSIQQVVATSVGEVRQENKLVVMTAAISTDVTRQEAITSWGMYWGTNVARVAVKDARVQWVIDCNKMQPSDYSYNEGTKVLSVNFPRPHVDASMVAIDPGRVLTLDLRGGWARFDKDETRDHALAEMRPTIIAQASALHLRECAEGRGMEATTKLLQPLAATLSRDGVTVRVAWRD